MMKLKKETKERLADLEDRVAELSDIVNILIGRLARLENEDK